jgi:hypothetical protein
MLGIQSHVAIRPTGTAGVGAPHRRLWSSRLDTFIPVLPAIPGECSRGMELTYNANAKQDRISRLVCPVGVSSG